MQIQDENRCFRFTKTASTFFEPKRINLGLWIMFGEKTGF